MNEFFTYDPDKAEEVRIEGQKNLQELMEAIKPLMLEPWSDISRKNTEKEIEAGLLKRKILSINQRILVLKA